MAEPSESAVTVRSPFPREDRRKRRTMFVVTVRRGAMVDHEQFYELDKAEQFVERLIAEGAALVTPTTKP
jgi:hypothetical protein